MAKRAQRFLEEIFTSYIKEPRQLPKDLQAKIANEGKHRVVADYIASMTDRSALLEYRRLFDPLMRP
jgi:dGTPase